jgi:iron complex transport system ATP-binding protein
LILDEPCTGLDIFSRELLLHSLETICGKASSPTVLYVTHRIEEILPVFSHTLLLRRGEVFLTGKTEDVLSKANLSGFFERDVDVEKQNQRVWMKVLQQ